MRRFPALVLALALAACSASTPSVEPTGTATELPDPEPSRTKPAKAPPPRARWAAVTNGRQLFVYDVKRNFLRAAAEGKRLSQPTMLSPTEVAFIEAAAEGTTASLMVMDLRTRQIQTMFTVPSGISAYAWSPDRELVAFITHDEHDFPLLRYRRILTTQTTRAVTTLARAPGREFAPDDQVLLDWNNDGSALLVVYTPADGEPGEVPPDQSQMQVRSRSGDLLFAADHDEDPTEAVWSANSKRVYFRTRGGARAWNAGSNAIEGVAGGTRWYDPWVSPDGKLLAYDTGPHRADARVRVLDLRTGVTRTIGPAGRFHPVFATTTKVWVQALRRCSGLECVFPVIETDDTYAINLDTGRERAITVGKLTGIDVLYR